MVRLHLGTVLHGGRNKEQISSDFIFIHKYLWLYINIEELL